MQTGTPNSIQPDGDGFPGFDGVRWLAAWAVVFSHSFPIASGPSALDPLAKLLGEGNSLGNYAVRTFFILSGFLLMRSLDHPKSDPLRFLANRLLRIIPGFCFAVIVTILVLGPILCGLSLPELLFSQSTWLSIYWSIVGLADVSSLPATASRFPALAGFLNGSLWSIPYELVCYLFLLSIHMILRSANRVALVATVVSLISLLGPRLGLTTVEWDVPGEAFHLPYIMLDKTLPYFCGGVAFYAIHKRWPFSARILCLAIGALLVSGFYHLQSVFFAFSGPVLAVWLGKWAWLSWPMRKSGDVSYGIYLFGWPVALAIALSSDSLGPLAVFWLSVPLVFLFAWLMRRLVEDPVNKRLKPAILRRTPRFTRNELPSVGLHLWTQRIAYWGFFLGLVRFLFYPWVGSANWFGYQIYQLGGLGAVVGLVLAANRLRPAVLSPAPASAEGS